MKRSARLSLYLKPDNQDKLRALSLITGESMNGLINLAVIEYLDARQEQLKSAEELMAYRDELTKKLQKD